MMKKITLFLLFVGLIYSNAYSQRDTVNLQKDSINNYILEEYNAKIEDIEKQRIQDSIKKSSLEAEINSLKTTDNLKKEELQKQLQEINNKENKRLTEKREQIENMRLTAKGYPVLGFFDDTLFVIYSKLGSFSTKDRAEAITQKIQELTDIYNFNADTLKLLKDDASIDIVCGESIIISITENDALWNNSSKQESAENYKEIIINAVNHYHSETSIISIFKKIALALLILIIVVGLIFYMNKLFVWTSQKIEAQENQKIKGIKIKNYTLFDAKRQVNALLFITKLIKWFLILLIIYIAIPMFFWHLPKYKKLRNYFIRLHFRSC